MHLLYFRFWHRVMQQLGLVHEDEPCKRLVTQGIVNGPDGRKMSKRWGNVVAPGPMVDKYGADTLRALHPVRRRRRRRTSTGPTSRWTGSSASSPACGASSTRGRTASPCPGADGARPGRAGRLPRAAPQDAPDHPARDRGVREGAQVQHRHRRADGARERALPARAEDRRRTAPRCARRSSRSRRCSRRSRRTSAEELWHEVLGAAGARPAPRRRALARASTPPSSRPTPSPSPCR